MHNKLKRLLEQTHDHFQLSNLSGTILGGSRTDLEAASAG
ncbi:hypothetical protein GCM10011533_15270 [Streptosporangium jomthongense]|nr:hypothetical protein GCM10011533_15270 [Streptosporangium jomthongense]